MTNHPRFPEWLTAQLEEHGAAAALAAEVGVHRSTVSRWASGDTLPTDDVLAVIAAHFLMSPKDVIAMVDRERFERARSAVESVSRYVEEGMAEGQLEAAVVRLATAGEQLVRSLQGQQTEPTPEIAEAFAQYRKLVEHRNTLVHVRPRARELATLDAAIAHSGRLMELLLLHVRELQPEPTAEQFTIAADNAKGKPVVKKRAARRPRPPVEPEGT